MKEKGVVECLSFSATYLYTTWKHKVESYKGMNFATLPYPTVFFHALALPQPTRVVP